jgi:thioredoxin reductase (NADPH)
MIQEVCCVNEKVIIIGSGPAGLTSAIYTARAHMNPLVIEGFQTGGMPGGQLMTTGIVENYPGFPDGIEGRDLIANMKKQAEKMGSRFEMDDVVSVQLTDYPFVITTMGGSSYSAQALIIATGATARRLSLDSEKKFWGKGISACAVCDGPLPIFRDNPVAVIGGGDAAIEEACFMTHFASKVSIIHRRDSFRACKAMQARVFANKKIEVHWNKTVEEFLGDSFLNTIILKDTVTGELSTLPVAGAFEAIGHHPNTVFLHDQLSIDKNGYISVTPGTCATSVAGVFAAGDVRDSTYRQAATAVGSGVMAAIEAENWLEEKQLESAPVRKSFN